MTDVVLVLFETEDGEETGSGKGKDKCGSNV